MSSWKWLPNFIFLISLINLVAIVRSQFPTEIFIHYNCSDNGSRYPRNSMYERNLNTSLSSVPQNINANGFYNASTGENPDRVNVIALCRADLQPSQCRDYMKNATAEILKRCPNQKQAILWHEFCMVRFSDEAIFGTLANSPMTWGNSTEKITNRDVFYRELDVLLNSLHDHAANNSSPKKFAAATRGVDDPSYPRIYAFEQCTPDITSEECGDCLNKSAQQIRECCDGARGVRILSPSCYLRFETDPYPFYNVSMVELVFQPPTPPMPPPPPPSPQPPGKGKNTSRTIIIVIVPIVACLILALCIGIYLKTKKMRTPRENADLLRMRRKSKTKEIHETDNESSTVESLQYDFGTMRAATNSFSDANELGQGGFGVVYKGKLPSRQEIAVKRLSMNSAQGDLEFKNEVLLMARLHHRNLVRLLGFSLERSERLLVYEFVENGSLDRFIFDPIKRQYLDWDTRYKIIGGVAKGLLYLHEESRLRIIHRDLKASNVLLDDEMNPKISDFGMARLIVQDETQGSTSRIVGTYGYMAPEYVMQGQFSSKSDVFSFGVLVLEIVSGQKANRFQSEENMEHLLSCAWKNWHKGKATHIIDPTLRTFDGSLSDILRCIHIGLLCVQENAVDRPTMATIVLMLTSFSITLPIPSRPAFFVFSSLDPEISLFREQNSRPIEATESSKNRSGNSIDASINDDSMSELYPR